MKTRNLQRSEICKEPSGNSRAETVITEILKCKLNINKLKFKNNIPPDWK